MLSLRPNIVGGHQMRTRIKYLIWKATGKNRLIRFAYILFRRYRLNLLSLNRDISTTIQAFRQLSSYQQSRKLKMNIISCMYQYGISPDEYFLFNFDSIDDKRRQSYLTNFNRLAYYAKLNDYRHDRVFTHKYETYQNYFRFYKRDVLLLAKGSLCFNDFELFYRKNPKFIFKPVSGSCGQGVRVFDSSDCASAEEVYSWLRDREGLVEELIVQDERLARFHPNSVNTVRMPQLITRDGEVLIFSPVLRVGQKNAVVDNAGAGGIFANIDPTTGVVYTDGFDYFGNRYDKHPMTGVVFRGFKIPRWEEAVSLVKELALLRPTVRYIGWDLALTPKGWVVVEANNGGEFKVLQIADNRGLRYRLDELI